MRKDSDLLHAIAVAVAAGLRLQLLPASDDDALSSAETEALLALAELEKQGAAPDAETID